jgi:hypothetical protein
MITNVRKPSSRVTLFASLGSSSDMSLTTDIAEFGVVVPPVLDLTTAAYSSKTSNRFFVIEAITGCRRVVGSMTLKSKALGIIAHLRSCRI